MNNMGAQTYHSLLVRESKSEAWIIEFGDYELGAVKDECDDYWDKGFIVKIIHTPDNQAAIEQAVAELNRKVMA